MFVPDPFVAAAVGCSAGPSGLVTDPFILLVRESNRLLIWFVLSYGFYFVSFIITTPQIQMFSIRDSTYFVADLFAAWGRTISSFCPDKFSAVTALICYRSGYTFTFIVPCSFTSIKLKESFPHWYY